MKGILVRLIGMTSILAATSITPAFASGRLGLSVDGVHWSQSITRSLFDQTMRWVPGDSETATFFVRNQGGTPGDLAVDVLGSHTDDLVNSRHLHITAQGGGGSWTTVSDGGTHRLLTEPNIPNGHVDAIRVNVALDFSSPNQTQIQAADLNFRVTLSESLPHGDTGGNSSELPGTGAPETAWYSAIGAMLIGIGLAFVSKRREHDQEEANV